MQRIGRFLTATMLSLVATVVGVGTLATPAAADGCYTWGRTLSQGASGEDVRQLQIRVSGYPGYGAVLGLDGAFGPATKAASPGSSRPGVSARTASPARRPSARSMNCRTRI